MVPNFRHWLRVLGRSWRLLIGFAIPILLSPLLRDYGDKASMCGFVLLMMIFYWMLEPVNLYMTALLPVALFPLFGISTTEDTCMQYMKAANMMFFGGLIVGIALEHCNLHRRIALKVVILFGTSIKNLMAGVMLVTMFLSMWINNTATTAMMIPIVDSILVEIDKINTKSDHQEGAKNELASSVICSPPINGLERPDSRHCSVESVAYDPADLKKSPKLRVLRKSLLLSIAYSANVGGTATLTGTGTNLVFQEVFNTEFASSNAISFTSWFIYAFPAALLTVIAAWLLLFLFFARVSNESQETGTQIRQSAQKNYDQLGPLTFHETGVLVHFIILVLLWFFRDPVIIPGWASLLTDKKDQIKDAVPVMLIAISMFLFPANLHQLYRDDEKPKEIKRLLNWKVVQANMTWGVFILLGGGFALAHGTKVSKLNDWFSKELGSFSFPPLVTTLILVVLSALITEMASNVATANVVLPVIAQLAVDMHVNPLMYMVPVTIGISFAFMFPVSTPPNAIVFEHLDIDVIEMVKPGFAMNLIAVSIQLIFINTLGRVIFDLDQFPDWAIKNATALHLGPA